VLVVLALGCAGAALAANGEPQKHHNPADMARARSVVLRPSDLGSTWKATPATSSENGSLRCRAFAPDESDLTETGAASSPDFSQGLQYVSSYASLFETAAQAQASWSRVVRPGLMTCLRTLFEQGASSGGTTTKVTGTGVLAVPRLAPRTAGYRLSFTATNSNVTLRGAVDIVLLGRARIDAALLYVAFGTPSQALERRLDRIIAARLR